MGRLVLCVAIVIAGSASAAATELSGSVHSSSGKPLAGAVVVGAGMREIVETDANGQYQLSVSDREVLFQAEHYRPVVKILGETDSHLDVVLEPVGALDWRVPNCTLGSAGTHFVGERLRFVVPAGAILHRGGDVDYEDFAIGYGAKSRRVWLYGIAGPTASMGRPPQAWITASVEWTVRAFEGEDYHGLDAHGRTRDLRYWRYVGQFGQEVRYSGADAAAARYFDAIIDACCIKPIRPQSPPN